MTLTSGKSIDAFVLKTGSQAVTGTMTITNNGRIGKLIHQGNEESLYFVTTSRIYRVALDNITSGNTTWQSDVMTEVPPGGSAADYPASGALSSCEIASSTDTLYVATTTGRAYRTQYNTSGLAIDRIFLMDDKQMGQSLASNIEPHPSTSAIGFSIWAEGGILYLARLSNAQTLNQLYAIPALADAANESTSNQVLITPSIATVGAIKLYRLYLNAINYFGSDINYTVSADRIRVFVRTSGISDNTGSWTELSQTYDISSLTPTSEIQFKFAFYVLGSSCIPTRLIGFAVTYEDSTTDSHYEPSVGNSNVSENRIAYRQSALWSSEIPNMRIRIYNVSTGMIILDDNTLTHTYGIWEYSSDFGSNWNAWDTTKDAVGYYIRYTPTSLPAGVRVRSLLTQS